jgi:phosphoribosylanthranilate isomerase
VIVKVCGITNAPDAHAAIEAGANALGFNFWSGSPRYLPVETASAFVPGLEGAVKVGVFVDTPAAEVAQVAARLALDVVQLHGSAHPPAGVRYWRAVSVRAGFDSSSLKDDAAEAFLLDAPAGELHGGTGRTFDWNLVRASSRRIVVAGGLDASNVALAIATVRPWGVDACSRLEISAGKKDHGKVAAFVQAALGASIALSRS